MNDNTITITIKLTDEQLKDVQSIARAEDFDLKSYVGDKISDAMFDLVGDEVDYEVVVNK